MAEIRELKAWIAHAEDDFESAKVKVHDLNMLDDLCREAGIFLGMNKSILARLSAYAVLTRYPG